MKMSEALKVKEALIVLSNFTGLTPEKIGSLINLYSEPGYQKLIEASKMWNKFEQSTFEERAEMLGIQLSKSKDFS